MEYPQLSPEYIKDRQDGLVAIMEKEINNPISGHKPSSFKASVWLQASTGRFLFDDGYVRPEIIEPLIENKTLVFLCFADHQGEPMVRYVLSKYAKKI